MGIGVVKEDKNRSVIVSGDVYLYHAKAPFSVSGLSVKGALEYDPDDDRVRCHECGHWFRSIGSHLKMHDISLREYKAKHGLSMGTALCSERVRETRIAVAQKGLVPWSACHKRFHSLHAKRLAKARLGKRVRHKNQTTETLNARKQCPEQLLKALRDFGAQLGRTPRIAELCECGISVRTLRWIFGSVGNAMWLANMSPVCKGGAGKLSVFTREQVVATLRNFIVVHGRRPTYSDHNRGLLPTQSVYKRLFKGGWREAVNVATASLVSQKAGVRNAP